MGTLYLLRHAKAARAAVGMRDFDRPLDPTGLADASALGEIFERRGYGAAQVLCSAALRTRQTLEQLERHVRLGPVSFSDRLYSTDAPGALAEIRQKSGGADSLLVVGHNPTLEELAALLSGTAEPAARRAQQRGFPPCALAVIALPGPVGSAAPAGGRLEALIVPGDA